MNKFKALKAHTTIVADTGEIGEIKKYKPTDATTNPSLILKASKNREYAPLIDEAIAYGKRKGGADPLYSIITKLNVNFGAEILRFIPGRVSTEVHPKLSFDVEGSVAQARQYIGLYREKGVDPERVLVKLPATWEGILAATQLEKEGIHCNMTLIFCLPQAIACAEMGHVSLISPFVGRISDWYQKVENRESYPPDEDPGVLSVIQIFNYYKKFEVETQIMGASFRNVDQVTELAGIDLLTISPHLLNILLDSEGLVPRKLYYERAVEMEIKKIAIDEKIFRWKVNENAMATEKLAEGIRNFAGDTAQLEKEIRSKI